MTSSTSPTTTEGGAGNADAQSIVPIAAGVGGGVAALLLLLLITALIVAAIAVTLRRKNKRELSEEYKGWQVHKSPFHQETSFLAMSYASWLEPSTWHWLQLLHGHDLFRILLSQ